MSKGTVSWTKRDEDGEKFHVYAHLFGKEWSFYIRQRRYDQWQALDPVPLDDWLELLDGVERRVARRLMPPAEIARVKKLIRENYPEAE